MKCHSCGYGLHIEDEKCPHCGKENPYFKKHRADMGRYEQDFRQVKKDVYTKTGFFTRMTAKIAIIAVLVAVELGVLVFHHYSWDIQRAILKNQAEENLKEYTELLDSFEQDGKYMQLSYFYDENSLHNSDEYEEYHKVQRMCGRYQYVYINFMKLYDENSYGTMEDKIESLCNDLEDFYEATLPQPYDKQEYYSEQHMTAMENMQKDVEALLITYGNLTKEEAENFKNLSNARKQLALERGLGLDEN